MSDFQLVSPQGWEYDLQSVYSAYIGYFQQHNIPWYERSWGHLFASFEEFLAFSWPVITVTDTWTGRAHVVTRMTSVGAFLRMIKTRFGETLPIVDNMLKITPFETAQRHLRTVTDWPSYRKIHSTLPAIMLAAVKVRIKAGEAKTIRDLWEKKDKSFLAIDFEWSERNNSSYLEWGYAAVRCGHLESVGHWPPAPDNYRKGHYIVAEYVDKITNKHAPNYPWMYAFGDSQVTPKAKVPQVIQAVISSLASPDSETTANNLVLVGHGIQGDLSRLEEMKIKVPHNVLIVDTSSFERSLFSSGQRGTMIDAKTGKSRTTGSTLSLEHLLRSLGITTVPCQLHNSGNDAFMCLFALQRLLDPENTPLPTPKPHVGRPGAGLGAMNSNIRTPVPLTVTTSVPGHGKPAPSPVFMGYLDSGEFGQVRRSPSLRPHLSASMGSARPNLTVGGDWRRNGMP